MALKKCNSPGEPLFGLPEISSGQVVTNNRSQATTQPFHSDTIFIKILQWFLKKAESIVQRF